jgi:hypothetical protein
VAATQFMALETAEVELIAATEGHI